MNATRDFQEFNPGVSFTWEDDLNYSLGAYYNSYEKISVLGAVSYDFPITGDFALGLFAGLSLYPGDGDRFEYAIGDLVPLIGVQAR